MSKYSSPYSLLTEGMMVGNFVQVKSTIEDFFKVLTPLSAFMFPSPRQVSGQEFLNSTGRKKFLNTRYLDVERTSLLQHFHASKDSSPTLSSSSKASEVFGPMKDTPILRRKPPSSELKINLFGGYLGKQVNSLGPTLRNVIAVLILITVTFLCFSLKSEGKTPMVSNQDNLHVIGTGIIRDTVKRKQRERGLFGESFGKSFGKSLSYAFKRNIGSRRGNQ